MVIMHTKTKKDPLTLDILRHDIKNEIAVIKAFAELIKRQKDIGATILNYAEKINTRANEVVKLLNKFTGK